MKYEEVVKKAKAKKRQGNDRLKLIGSDTWNRGDQINLWTYWQGYQLVGIDEKGVDILLVGQDWGSPCSDGNVEVINSIQQIQDGVDGARYYSTNSPTDRRLALMFTAFGDDVNIFNDVTKLRLFFTNYFLGYRKDSETGGMTKTIMRQDSEFFDDLVEAIKPKIIICLGKITYELVSRKCAKEFTSKLSEGEPLRAEYPNKPDIIVYGVAHPGSRGLYNIGGKVEMMKKAWIKIAEEYYSLFEC